MPFIRVEKEVRCPACKGRTGWWIPPQIIEHGGGTREFLPTVWAPCLVCKERGRIIQVVDKFVFYLKEDHNE